MIQLMPHQEEFIQSRERYPLMLAHRRAGKTHAGIHRALSSKDDLEVYVCSSMQLLTEAIEIAGKISGASIKGSRIRNVFFCCQDLELLGDVNANVTLDEPYDPDVFVAALAATSNNSAQLRVVASAGAHLSLIHQFCDGGLFKVHKTDINRSEGFGFPFARDWATRLEERGSVQFRQELLCEHGAAGHNPEPALLYYDITYSLPPTRSLIRTIVPGTCVQDARRVFFAGWSGPPARVHEIVMSASPIRCSDCLGSGAIYENSDGLFYCSTHRKGTSLYISGSP